MWGVRVRLSDVALGVGTAAAVVAGTALFGLPVTAGGTAPLAGSLGLLVLVRRLSPLGVLVLSELLVLGFGISRLGVPGWMWPATVAYATAVLAGRLGWTIVVAVTSLVAYGSVAGNLLVTGFELLWLVAVLTGCHAYLTRQRAGEVDERSRATEERLRMARELHDVVAHTLSVVGVHLNVAVDALDDADNPDPEEVRAALRLAQDVRGQAMADLKSLIGVLRADPVTTDLPALVERTRAAGLTVRLTGDTDGLPAPVSLAVYRIAQEGLTNVLRHAHATSATVTVVRDPREVTVTVTDDGQGTGHSTGHGIDGMRERVTALGGALRAEPGTHGGFEVRATIPVRG